MVRSWFRRSAAARHADSATGPSTDPDAISDRFAAAWTGAADGETATDLLLPERLARACASVLPVDGVSLGVIEGELRVPLGASNENARLAEKLQFTQGEGPCLAAARHRRVQVATAEQLARQWPLFAQELFTRTPYRAVMTLPLTVVPGLSGALDLFFIEQARMDLVKVPAASTVAALIGEALTAAAATDPAAVRADEAARTPVWLANRNAERRMVVWIAIGMAMTRFDLEALHALALLRSYAYGHDTVLDDIAGDIVDGTLNLDILQP